MSGLILADFVRIPVQPHVLRQFCPDYRVSPKFWPNLSGFVDYFPNFLRISKFSHGFFSVLDNVAALWEYLTDFIRLHDTFYAP